MVMTPEQFALAKSKLSSVERAAYSSYTDSGKAPLSPVVERQLYELFLNGKTTTDIQKINPQFSLGMIVRARIDGDWDSKRETHIADLLEGIKDRVQHTQLEAVNFACDLLSAVHKMQGDKIKKYLQTGDEADLEGAGLNLGLKTYETVIRLLLELTGQNKEKDKKVEVTHKVEGASPSMSGLSPAKAARILEIIDGKEPVDA